MNQTEWDVVQGGTDDAARLDWDALLKAHDGPVLSLFMPIERVPAHAEQNRIRLKDLLKKAEAQLADCGVADGPARLAPLTKMLSEDKPFWGNQGEGLAFFAGPDFQTAHRLPFRPEAEVAVGSRCFVRPLLPLRQNGDSFHLLALSRGRARLFQGHRYGLHEVALPDDVPTSLEAMLKVYDFEKSLQFHSADAAERGNDTPMYHGQGGTDRNARDKEYLAQFLRQIDQAVGAQLNGSHSPLVVAGTEDIRGHYHAVSAYPYRFEKDIDTHPDELGARELHERAWAVVEPKVRSVFDEVKGTYMRLAEVETNRVGSTLETVAPAACFARVERLFVPKDGHYFGTVDLENNTATLHPEARPGADELVNLTIAETLKNGGTVHTCIAEELPATPVAAIFRY